MAFAAAPTTTRTALASAASSRNPSLLLARRGLVLVTTRQETSNRVTSAQLQGRSAATKASWSALSVVPRGGAMAAAASAAASSAPLAPVVDGIRAFFGVSTPHGLFHSILLGLALSTVALKTVIRSTSSSAAASTDETSSTTADSASSSSAWSADAVTLRRKFLAVFWLLRCADWLQGPYFYEVYASKVLRGATSAVSLGLVSKLFLTGFASTALFGPTVGRLSDQHGRKKATLAFSLIYAVGALSTKSSVLWMLFVGRIWSGIGTSLLFSAPESWLVGAAQQNKVDGSLLGPIFGTAYAGDAIVAILAGVMAGQVASIRGPTGPFELSTAFLAAGGILAALLWKENKAPASSPLSKSEAKGGDETTINASKPTIRDAVRVVKNDPKIWLVGCVQSLFEAAMYIFVLQWPPAVRKFVSSVYGGGGSSSSSGAVSVPYGTIFSCFMACCLFGSTLFGHLAKDSTKVSTEKFTAAMLCLATLAMGTAAWAVSSTSTSLLSAPQMLAALVASFFAFEACVGMYFPSIGTLRSKYVPDSHRGVIMNLFGIPLNVLVVTVFLSISKLGTSGALAVSTAALGVASGCMLALNRRIRVAAPQ
jgi:MFS transporter, MFS domain-containing protein family, molybdate-anion transporter